MKARYFALAMLLTSIALAADVSRTWTGVFLAMSALAQQEAPPAKPAIVDIKNTAGQSVGTAKLSEAHPAWSGTAIRPAHSMARRIKARTVGPGAGDPGALLEGLVRRQSSFPGLTLGNDSRSVFANRGTAIVFPAAPGASGPTRIACGIIRRPKE